MLAFLFEFLVLIVASVLFIPACLAFDERKYGWTSTMLLCSVGCVSYFYWDQFITAINSLGVINATLQALLYYSIAGVVTSFAYWVIKCWKIRDRFDEALEEVTWDAILRNFKDVFRVTLNREELDSEGFLVLKKYTALALSYSDIFRTGSSLRFQLNDSPEMNALSSKLRSDDDLSEKFYDQLIQTAQKLTCDLLPPKFSMYRDDIIAAALVWPVTIIWILFFNFIKQVTIRLITYMKSTFDVVSKICFGKV